MDRPYGFNSFAHRVVLFLYLKRYADPCNDGL